MSINDEFWKRQTGHAPAESNMAQNIALLQAIARTEARNAALEEAAVKLDQRAAEHKPKCRLWYGYTDDEYETRMVCSSASCGEGCACDEKIKEDVDAATAIRALIAPAGEG